MAADLRLRSLAHLDPTAVQLPHGTEVVTRVARVAAERTVPEGAIGRVVRIEGDAVDVLVVGVGTIRYARSEVVPRRRGQAAWSVRRAESWDALRPCVVLESIVGSRAWGLADESSDTDVRGVFALPLPWWNRLVDPPRDLVGADSASTYWELGKTVRQALRADPNTLEMLFVPSVRALDPIGDALLAARDAFVSAQVYASFGRYALSQLARLAQSARLAEHRHHVLAWLRERPPTERAPRDDWTLDAVAARLATVDPRAHATEADRLLAAKQHVKQLYRSLHDQGLIAASDFPSLVAFARERAPDLDLPRELRPKNAYNLLRLIAAATEWLREGVPRFEVSGAFRDRLLAIKRGEVPLDDVIRWAEEMTPALEEARQTTRLPRGPDVARADELLANATAELARRWVAAEPGPFGRDAPAPHAVEWDDPADRDDRPRSGTELGRRPDDEHHDPR